MSSRVGAFKFKANEEGMRLALDLIDEVKDEANAKIVQKHTKLVHKYPLDISKRV